MNTVIFNFTESSLNASGNRRHRYNNAAATASAATVASATGGLSPPHNRNRRFTLVAMNDPLGLRPSAVDVYSRLLFPLAFLLFHVVYWSVSLLNIQPLPKDVVILHR